MPRASEICRMDAVTLAARVRAKELSAIEVADAVIAHMEEVEPHLHAFCTPAPDYARAAARQVDARDPGWRGPGAARGRARRHQGPRLHQGPADRLGLHRLRGLHARRGRRGGRAPEGTQARSSSARPTCRSSATAARATMPCSRRPATRGTWSAPPAAPARARAPSVAAGDGAARGRQRRWRLGAHSCRPSAGWWGSRRRWGGCRSTPAAGTSAIPASRAGRGSSISGPMTRTVADSALMLSVMAGPDDRDRHSLPAADVDWLGSATAGGDLRGLRVAYSADWGYAAVDPEVRPHRRRGRARCSR